MDNYDMTISVHVYGTRREASSIGNAIQEALENAAVDERAPLSKALGRLKGGFTLEVSTMKKRQAKGGN